jgi:hypothetical protein
MLAKRNAMSLFGGEPCEGFAGAAQGLGRDDLGGKVAHEPLPVPVKLAENSDLNAV